MRCPLCGHENPEKAKFCNECAANLQLTFSLSSSPIEPVKHTFISEPERKIVTALFSDLTGYTALTERLDPEQVKELTGDIFAGINQIISKYEGFIDRLLGDGVLVLFGVPRAHEEDAAWAVNFGDSC